MHFASFAPTASVTFPNWRSDLGACRHRDVVSCISPPGQSIVCEDLELLRLHRRVERQRSSHLHSRKNPEASGTRSAWIPNKSFLVRPVRWQTNWIRAETGVPQASGAWFVPVGEARQ